MSNYLLTLVLCTVIVQSEYLGVSNKKLVYGNQNVFLSGVNAAWVNYGSDFGNNHYTSSGPFLEEWIRQINSAEGNIMRIWIHVEGVQSPQFDSSGYVIGTDQQKTLISDLSKFLDYAAEKDVFIILVLWNGALIGNDQYKNLIWDDSKLETYINNALRPMVLGLKEKPALAAWEIINEPEGSIRIESNSNPCYSTLKMGEYGAGWTGVSIPMKRFLKFINLQSSAIHREDPKALVTVGSWSEHPQSDAYPDTYNYYKDNCLIGAGGATDGTIDFYQIHSYSWDGKWNDHSPFKVSAHSYLLDKPVIIGEFSSSCAMNEGIKNLFAYAYNQDYNGVLSWQYNAGGHCSDDQATQREGMLHIGSWNHKDSIKIDIR